MIDRYILNAAGEPEPCDDIKKWATIAERSARRVDRTEVGDTVVSTVFLMLDHDFSGKGPPVLWETMTFPAGGFGEEQDRCSGSRADAQAMHDRMVAKVKKEKGIA